MSAIATGAALALKVQLSPASHVRFKLTIRILVDLPNMRWSKLGAVLGLLGSDCAIAGRFPRAVSGNGFLAVPVGTIDRPKRAKRDEGGILTTLENMDFFYATEGRVITAGISVHGLIHTQSPLARLPKQWLC